MKLSSLFVGLMLVFVVAAFVSFGWSLEYACAHGVFYGWSVVSPVAFTIAAMLALVNAERFAASGR